MRRGRRGHGHGPIPALNGAPTLHGEPARGDLVAALEGAEFTVERLEAVLGTHELSARPADTLVHVRRLEGGDAFATLARLFVVGVPVELPIATEVLAPLAPERLARLGLVRVEGDEVQPLVRLVPHGDYYVCSDLHHESALGTPSDYVPGIQAPSVTLAKLAVRRRAEVALDLGTGCGIQALLAAKHSERVVATDVNPRALRFAAFNLQLNGIDNVELRPGGAFEPVEGSRFDLVVSNPPYVVSPDSSFAYRDSGLPADELCRRIVQDVPRHLADGGFAHILVSWVHEPGRWAEPLREWVAGRGCDAWLLHFGSQDPLSHSAQWLGPLGESDPAEYEAALDRWLAYLRRNQIEAIGYGAVVLRRREGGANWIREEELSLERLESAGDHTLHLFAAEDYLQAVTDDRDLLDRRFRLADGHRLEHTLVGDGETYVVHSQTLSLEEGFGFRVGVDRYTASLLPHFDGERPLGDVIARAAARVDLDPGDRERFLPATLPVVRRLLELGFLRPDA
jgi:SAM-dependent methyltransferase